MCIRAAQHNSSAPGQPGVCYHTGHCHLAPMVMSACARLLLRHSKVVSNRTSAGCGHQTDPATCDFAFKDGGVPQNACVLFQNQLVQASMMLHQMCLRSCYLLHHLLYA